MNGQRTNASPRHVYLVGASGFVRCTLRLAGALARSPRHSKAQTFMSATGLSLVY